MWQQLPCSHWLWNHQVIGIWELDYSLDSIDIAIATMTHISALQFLSSYIWNYPFVKLFIFETITQYLRNYLIFWGLSPCCMMIMSGLLSKRLPILECYNYLWRNLHLHIPINLHKNCFYNNPIKPNMFLQAMVDEVRGRQRDGELHLGSHEGLPQVQGIQNWYMPIDGATY